MASLLAPFAETSPSTDPAAHLPISGAGHSRATAHDSAARFGEGLGACPNRGGRFRSFNRKEDYPPTMLRASDRVMIPAAARPFIRPGFSLLAKARIALHTS